MEYIICLIKSVVLPLNPQCGRVLRYYHSKRRTVRLFRSSDWKMIANYSLNSEATTFAVTDDSLKLVVGGVDGSVTILVLADNAPEAAERSLGLLRSLPSRLDKTEQAAAKKLYRRDPIIRFRCAFTDIIIS
jgi:hypothetical protein